MKCHEKGDYSTNHCTQRNKLQQTSSLTKPSEKQAGICFCWNRYKYSWDTILHWSLMMSQLYIIFWKICYRFFFFLQIPKDWMTQRLFPSSKSCSQHGLWQGRMEAAAAVAPQCSVQEAKAETWGFLNWHYFTQVKSYILRISRIKWK